MLLQFVCQFTCDLWCLLFTCLTHYSCISTCQTAKIPNLLTSNRNICSCCCYNHTFSTQSTFIHECIFRKYNFSTKKRTHFSPLADFSALLFVKNESLRLKMNLNGWCSKLFNFAGGCSADSLLTLTPEGEIEFWNCVFPTILYSHDKI